MKAVEFLVAPVSLRRVAIFRLLVALMLAFVFKPAGLSPVSDWGGLSWIGRAAMSPVSWVIIYLLIGAFGAGLFARVSGILLFLMLVPHACLSRGVQSRQVMLFVLLCVSLYPGVSFRRWRATAGEPPPVAPVWPIRLVQLQLTVLYGINAIAKTTPHFLSGEALMGLSTRRNFKVDLTSGWIEAGGFDLPVWMLAIPGVLIEYWLAAGLWFKRTRYPTVVLGVAFHIGLTVIMTIFMLDLVTLFLYLAFLMPFAHEPFRAPALHRRG